ncbi:MAG TPA: GTP 3',8-cyclase MoaA [Solirubrobacteraceae bacterium]|jgi:cyclic pyranopterin phosphate synthase|nr:GTP 3',8-cyclase MoaA [Solirubrobacteraceae bacterium]
MSELVDRHQRPLLDLRVSVTDRCNLRCGYCMPREVFGRDYEFLPRSALLTFEEIARLCRLFAAAGVSKVRLTGGEPLLRRGLEQLVAMIAPIEGVDDLALTTNGLALAARAQGLRDAGLSRVTVSLDALDEGVMQQMSDTAVPLGRILEGIAAAAAAGLGPVKINMVVRRDTNEHCVESMADYAREHGHVLRLIEYMDVGDTNDWSPAQVVPAAESLALIDRRWPLRALPPSRPGEVARRYSYLDGGGEVGVIASVTEPFCQGCTRARLSADGRLYTCLFAGEGHDLRALLREGRTDAELSAHLRRVWTARADRYSELRARQRESGPARVEMSYIGG